MRDVSHLNTVVSVCVYTMCMWDPTEARKRVLDSPESEITSGVSHIMWLEESNSGPWSSMHSEPLSHPLREPCAD